MFLCGNVDDRIKKAFNELPKGVKAGINSVYQGHLNGEYRVLLQGTETRKSATRHALEELIAEIAEVGLTIQAL